MHTAFVPNAVFAVSAVRAGRPVSQGDARDPVPAWARPQVAWPFQACKPLSARNSVRPLAPSMRG